MRGGEVIELVSDLGGGKTTFVRGLARGVGSKDAVRSPSFTISHQYHAPRLTLHHFDFYRLEDPGIMQQVLLEVLDDPKNAAAIEWAGAADVSLPSERLTVHIKPTGEDSRRFTFTYPESLDYLLPKEAKS